MVRADEEAVVKSDYSYGTKGPDCDYGTKSPYREPDERPAQPPDAFSLWQASERHLEAARRNLKIIAILIAISAFINVVALLLRIFG